MRKQILIVDDEPEICESIELLLEDLGEFAFTKCSNPLDALEMIKEQGFDLVFCDIMMPEMTGIQLFDAYKEFVTEHEGKDEIPFVFVTAYASHDVRSSLIMKGAT